MAIATIWTGPDPQISLLLEQIASSARAQLESILENDDRAKRVWAIADTVLAIIVGIIRFGLLTDPRGFDAINDFESLGLAPSKRRVGTIAQLTLSFMVYIDLP